MNSFLTILITVGIILIAAYGVKCYFDFKISQGKETSNAPIRLAIGSLVVAFLAMVGFAPIVAGIIVQLLNHIPEVNLKETQSSEVIGAITFVVFCLAVVILVYVYYRYRNRLYFHEKNEGSGDSIVQVKNIVSKSNINAGGDIHIGDSENPKKKL